LLVLFFLGFHVSHGSPLPLTTYDDSMCLESFKCGSIDLRYPFYMYNTTHTTPDYSSYYSCGYTDLEIFCQEEGEMKTPILSLDGESYTILNISYDNHTIIIGEFEVLGGNGCPRVSHNVSFGQKWLSYTDSFESLAFFFDCYSAPGDHLPSDLEIYQINCKGFNSSSPAGSGGGVSYVFISGSEEHNASQEYQLADHCSEIFMAPVREDVLLGSGQLMLPTAYGGVLKRGFELEWYQSTDQPCYPCEKSGGRCAYSEKQIFLGCMCSGGKVLQNCHGSGATPAYAGPS
jgi:hypothetical protein